MRNRIVLLAILLLSVTALFAQRDYEPDLKGYVTLVSSPTEIDVNGVHIRMDGETQFFRQKGKKLNPIAAADARFYVGQVVKLYGKRHDKEHALSALQVNLAEAVPHPVEGGGVVDFLPASPDAGDHMLRADGYAILVPASVIAQFQEPLTADSAFNTNVWVTYHGVQRADGVVVADKVSFRPNDVSEGENRLREKTEHDPAAVDPGKHQSAVAQAFLGIDPRKIPPYKDEAMQARISAIGAKLVPKYQRDLPDSDETKINFRFQLVDEPKWHDAVAWPNGIVLVPHQIVERLKDDDEVAAVLADKMAGALEKQTYRVLPTFRKLGAANIAGAFAEAFVPGLGLGTQVATSATAERMLRKIMEQDARVSLALMHDAGFDIDAAPRAWWILKDKKQKGLDKTPLPAHSEYLYKVLGETWHSN